jgi:hypothetical protein
MSCDKLVYDLSSETEGSPNVFVRKDWLNIMDNQSQNYSSNQSVIDTSQLSNSNKWMSYREAYLQIPLLLTFTGSVNGQGGTFNSGTGVVTVGTANSFVGHNSDGSVSASAGSGVIGLKNWFGQIIHSFTVDYNGTTIIQQTPFINMWNTFKLLTSLSWDDVRTQGAHIGFYPDTSTSWSYGVAAGTCDGQGVCNNVTLPDWPSEFRQNSFVPTASVLGQSTGNIGLLMRQRYTVYDPCADITPEGQTPASAHTKNLLPIDVSKNMWQNHITGRLGGGSEKGYVQHVVLATVYLKHVHNFFDRIPLLKGVYMKMTMNLNNASATIETNAMAAASATAGTNATAGKLLLSTISVPVGGVCPFMIASAFMSQAGYNITSTATQAASVMSASYRPSLSSGGAPICAQASSTGYYADLSVGGKIISSLASSQVGPVTSTGAQSVMMYIPAYTFNPPFEQAYLSSPVKTIKYSDVYQYQVDGVSGSFNRLITNGLANIKSILLIPFLSPGAANNELSVAQFQSPFDSAGGGTTAPMVQINNFNVQVSGQNAIYNTERYTFEQYLNQTHGQNSVNGGLTDGLTSALINFRDWQSLYCYYYVNLERMLPVEQLVPKSVFIQGQLPTGSPSKQYDFYVFIEHGAQLKVDALTGARV